MSKNSAKQNYQSLIEWIATLKKQPTSELKERPSGKFSKADYYKKQGA